MEDSLFSVRSAASKSLGAQLAEAVICKKNSFPKCKNNMLIIYHLVQSTMKMPKPGPKDSPRKENMIIWNLETSINFLSSSFSKGKEKYYF